MKRSSSAATRAFFVLLLAGTCLAQTVHVANYSGHTFDGWKRCTVDVMPPHKAGTVINPDGDVAARYVLGRQIGPDVRVIDLRLRLEPGQVVSIDLSKAQPWDFHRGPLPANPEEFWGIPTIGGVRLQVLTA